jgi:hypothetical protein
MNKQWRVRIDVTSSNTSRQFLPFGHSNKTTSQRISELLGRRVSLILLKRTAQLSDHYSSGIFVHFFLGAIFEALEWPKYL